MPDSDTAVAGNEQVAEIIRNRPGRGVMRDDSLPTPVDMAVAKFDVLEGFKIEPVAAEPIVSQPLFVSWDSRGRMWVVQYRQYQFPAGLKIVRYDQHLRAVFDRVPEPPPHGTPGADKITVFEDTDGDGLYDTHKDVIDGLNIASAVQVGHGGIWVLNPPYLLFYPDADGDDVPDADPQVHLSGFGLQDTHSVANSMMWGPDGWLYGCNGSTTVGDVSSAVSKGVRFQGQCVWRYHPDTKEFEIYAEGGGNNFSLDIDSKGRVFTGTNGGNTRGYYFPQGSYSEKNWGKHGPLTNPYAFGYFRAMKFEGDGRRFPQAFCVYEGGLFPKNFNENIIAPNSLHNLVWRSERIPDGSTYRTVDHPNLVETSDRWFRPVYAGVGPDGAVYMADWYDSRLSHVSPVDDWHKESGRVYRIVPEGKTVIYQSGDLSLADSQTLIDCFSHENKWVRQRAVLELGWRGDASAADSLIKLVDDSASLEALWALNLIDKFDSVLATRWLSHSDADIRRWVVRLLGDRHEDHNGLAAMAATEPDGQVRSQLAATAKRLSADVGLSIVAALLRHDDDADDPHLPLMNWWAIEAHAESWPAIESMFADESLWNTTMVKQTILTRLVQRYASAGGVENFQHCAKLIAMAPDDASRGQLIQGIDLAFQGRAIPQLPESLDKALADYKASIGQSDLILSLRRGDAAAIGEAIKLLSSPQTDLPLAIEVANVFGEVNHAEAAKSLLALATGSRTSEPALQRVAIASLRQYDTTSIATTLLASFGNRISEEHGLRAAACRTLASRPAWALQLLNELTQWRIQRDQIPYDVVQQLRSYEDPEIAKQVEAVFGPISATATAEQIAETKRLRQLLAAAPGDSESGKAIFAKTCGGCHQLFGEGGKTGPPLDGYERGKIGFWVDSIVLPNLEIREGYQSYLVLTEDGRVINGIIAEQTPTSVTLRNADNQTTTIAREEIETLKALPTSLMPSDLLKEMSDTQIRDLYAYLSLGAK
ncbi:protein containing Putative membrane-bound dehydrogenase [Rhodopirellula maiorica SM1]|uniref:Protein containing Putative membrane-bound dehydrogenase n=1 Tax=Rhodopirellula maiorica SM1 TaxID=1265738 RepID=M5RTE4_9BACT|nr:PVC-type heme-binding CxxCH protein [Rhodopirellula maiorica]EMI22565.1 protein containing Putative membrane-bound dehydrogenase [Rhodopirellula maiorica SM1]